MIEYVSLRIVATVDRHGIYNNIKIINAYADKGVNCCCKTCTRPPSLDE